MPIFSPSNITHKKHIIMKRTILLLSAAFAAVQLCARDYLVQTPGSSLLISANEGGQPMFQYYGTRIDNPRGVYDGGVAMSRSSLPALGRNAQGGHALAIQQPDGSLLLDLAVSTVEEKQDNQGKVLSITMKDRNYPIQVVQQFKAWDGTDVISTWTEISNQGKKPVRLLKYYSAWISLPRGDNYINHQHGQWAAESFLTTEKVGNGLKTIANRNGLQNTQDDSPSLMLSMDGPLREHEGRVLGATLAWPGSYKLTLDARNQWMTLSAGINEDACSYLLDGGQTLQTPPLCMAFSNEGMGEVSRQFHRWARKYMLNQGDQPRDILLNSWEGVYMNITEPKMHEMMKDWAQMGGELFVMDDGWFGGPKYPRNHDRQGLGDWNTNTEKLPNGVPGLVKVAKENGIKFGIWIEPEMVNTTSELYEKHPDWILHYDGHKPTTGRGGTQAVLDLTNPKVQDFVFQVVDNLMQENPDLAYIKWDCNAPMMDQASPYLPAQKQQQVNVDYQLGLIKTLQRIRAKYPKLVIQDCASGGGRINYGLLPYFEEFWGSDDTDAKMRARIQWGESMFFPAVAMASHVSAEHNHQTGRVTPLKLRLDMAMTGRLGMELQPSQMNNADRDLARRGIEAYKRIRPVVQQGDLYRLHSPYEGDGISSLMYVSEDKTHAAFFAYNLDYIINQPMPHLPLRGLDPAKNYRITDLTPRNPNHPCSLNGKVISGKELLSSGLGLYHLINSLDASCALELVAE